MFYFIIFWHLTTVNSCKPFFFNYLSFTIKINLCQILWQIIRRLNKWKHKIGCLFTVIKFFVFSGLWWLNIKSTLYRFLIRRDLFVYFEFINTLCYYTCNISLYKLMDEINKKNQLHCIKKTTLEMYLIFGEQSIE